MYQLSIIIPTFNESKNVVPIYEQISEALKGISHEVIFVDDSNDNTPEIIQTLADNNSNVVLMHRENEKGLATAVLKGFELASGEYLSVIDADLQHPPAILRSMYAVVSNGYDFCVPSRFIEGGSDGGLNLYRKFVSGTARYIGKIMLNSVRHISDPTSGLFMFKRNAIEKSDLRPIGWKIMIEVLAMADYKTVCEIPYTFAQRNAGESKLTSKVTKEYLLQLTGLKKRELNHKNVRVDRLSPQKTKEYLDKLNSKC